MDDIGRSLSWGALGSFLQSAKPDSAVAAEVNPEIAEWSTTFKTNAILADIYDILAQFFAVMAAKGTDRLPKKMEKYPRSWRGKERAFKTVMKAKEWLQMLGGEKKNGRGT
ncbi:MAG: hypothetical protein IJ188_08350 [Clostridia bacterium]|nr:hypothetical protein [Clostridia bacterium]